MAFIKSLIKFFKKEQNKNNFENFPPIGGLMVSKMVVDKNMKPHFMFREKRTRPEDSGWRIFTGFESDEYTSNADNFGIYNPSTILRIDPSIEDILLKGVGSVYEKTDDNSEWYKVTDYNLEDNYLVVHRLTENWTIEINNLFERTIEKSGNLFYTTGDKSIRISIWNDPNKSREELYKEHKCDIENRDQTLSKTKEEFDFSDNRISRIGYIIQESDKEKVYDVLYAFSIIDKQVVFVTIYFDNKEDLNWAIETWKNIKLKE